MRRVPILLAIATLIITSCQKGIDPIPGKPAPTTPITSPGGLDYTNTKNVSVSIRLLAPDNSPLANVPVTFYSKLALQENGGADDAAAVFVNRMSDANGYF